MLNRNPNYIFLNYFKTYKLFLNYPEQKSNLLFNYFKFYNFKTIKIS
jgi:hypothetical protein